eukprot:764376-Hanusia_phi.AAC.2
MPWPELQGVSGRRERRRRLPGYALGAVVLTQDSKPPGLTRTFLRTKIHMVILSFQIKYQLAALPVSAASLVPSGVGNSVASRARDVSSVANSASIQRQRAERNSIATYFDVEGREVGEVTAAEHQHFLLEASLYYASHAPLPLVKVEGCSDDGQRGVGRVETLEVLRDSDDFVRWVGDGKRHEGSRGPELDCDHPAHDGLERGRALESNLQELRRLVPEDNHHLHHIRKLVAKLTGIDSGRRDVIGHHEVVE